MKVGLVSVTALAFAFVPPQSDTQPTPEFIQDWVHFISSSVAAEKCISTDTHNNHSFLAEYSSTSVKVSQFVQQRLPGGSQTDVSVLTKRLAEQVRKDVQTSIAKYGCSSPNIQPLLSFYKSHSDKGMFGGADLPWRPDAKIIAQLESRIRLPRGTNAIANYDRYYAGTYLDGRRVVRGIYLDPIFEREVSDPVGGRGPPPRVHIVEEIELPNVMDGGCGNMAIYFDLAAAEPPRASCGDPG